MKKVTFKKIKENIRAYYTVNVNWDYLEKCLEDYDTKNEREKGLLELEPDFQRAHVWDKEKQIKYLEFILRNGESGRHVYFNCKDWMRGIGNKMVLVDGLQRITAVKKFLDNKIKAFGHYYKEYEGRIPSHADFIFHVNNLRTRKEVLQWYLELNEGTVAHTTNELNKVKYMLKEVKE
tara:strand:- start:655 stop:1188 length:534 start_codon:yes stop_codon:yes gene_type:complete